MKKTWFVVLAIPFACYAWACSSSSSGDNTATDGGPGGSDGGGPGGGDGGGPGSDSGNPGTDGGGGMDAGPIGNSPINGIAAPTQLTMDVGGGGGYLDAPRFWGGKLYVADPLINTGNGVQYTIDTGTGAPTIFRDPSNTTTGTAIDSKTSTLIATEAKAGVADVVRLLADGGTTPLASAWDAGAGPLTNFDSPNDLTMRKSDGTIYFTDPGFQNNAAVNHVFRIGPTGAVRAVDTCADACQPNGLAISPKEDFLYVSYSYSAGTPTIKKFPINADGTLGAASTFVATPGAQVDGMAIDDSGNVYAAYLSAVAVFAPSGAKWGEIKLPNNVQPVHVAFGGADRKTLFIAGGANIFQVTVKVAGRLE